MKTTTSASSRIVIFIVVIVLAVVAGDVALWRSTRRGLYRDAVSELSTVSDLKRQHLEFWLADRREGMKVVLPLVAKGLVTAPDGRLTLQASTAEELRHQLPMDAVMAVLAVLLWTLRKREQTIAENASWSRRLFDEAPVAIAASQDGRFLRVNRAYARLLGYDRPEELIGRSPFETAVPYLPGNYANEISDAEMEHGIVQETVGRRRDGSEFPMEIRVSSLQHGGRAGRIGFAEDLSERKGAARLLEQSRDYYRRLLDRLPNPVWRADGEGRCIYVNCAWIEFTGRPLEQHLGHGWKSSVHPDDIARIDERAPLFTERQAFAVEYRVLHHSGEYRWITDDRRPYIDMDGTFSGYLGSCYDIHDLRTAQEQFRSLVEHAVDLITIVDVEGRIVYQNPRCESVLGYRPDEVVGTTLERFVHEDDLEGLFERVRQAPYGAPFRVRHKDGSYREVESMVTRMPGAEWRLVITSRDITERRALEAAAVSNERMNALGRVAANVAHEFNNVMQSITPFTAAIERQANGQATVIDAARQIHRAVRRGREITQEILRFSRPEPPERQPLDLRSWLAEVRETIAAYAGPKVDVRLECAGAALVVSADATQLHQAVTNLAVNACHAMPDGGVLILRAEQSSSHSGPSVTISVSDTGGGMAPDVLPHIFEPMFTTKRSRGTGLGLPITQQIVARHGGTITVETTAGAGSTFRIQLPSGASLAGGAEIAAPPRPTALVVEDDPTVAMAIETLLDLDGFQVINVATAGRAIEVAARYRPDIVVLDVGLPDMPGTELFGRLRSLHENLPTVFSTGHAEVEAKAVAAGELNVICLVKPYGYESLSQAVRDAGFAA